MKLTIFGLIIMMASYGIAYSNKASPLVLTMLIPAFSGFILVYLGIKRDFPKKKAKEVKA